MVVSRICPDCNRVLFGGDKCGCEKQSMREIPSSSKSSLLREFVEVWKESIISTFRPFSIAVKCVVWRCHCAYRAINEGGKKA